MKHNRAETPAYLIWVEHRPTAKKKGKPAFFSAVQGAARRQISTPIPANDIEVEIAYATTQTEGERIDTDNINKPTLDALKGVAYDDDRQVRHVSSTTFNKNQRSVISGRVEHMGRLFYSNKPDVLLISIYSDSRLAELGGEGAVQQRRYAEWQAAFNKTISQLKQRPA